MEIQFPPSVVLSFTYYAFIYSFFLRWWLLLLVVVYFCIMVKIIIKLNLKLRASSKNTFVWDPYYVTTSAKSRVKLKFLFRQKYFMY